VIEKAVSFGPGGVLTGITTEPGVGLAVPDAPAVLFWNVGINHHVGPYRVNVDLARSLAAVGITSLRFDISGMGDSDVRPGAAALDLDRAMDDVRDAMALLEKRKGIRRFVLVGFCSSTDAAHALAIADPRVVGVCFLEGYAFRTRGFYRRYPLRFLDRARWRRVFVKAQERLHPPAASETAREEPKEDEEKAAAGESVYTRAYPRPEQLRADYKALAARGVPMLFVFTGGDSDFNHARQFDEMLGAKMRGKAHGIELEYYPDADHTFARTPHRERVVARVRAWMQAHFSAR
jgi:dienelactone hydrolase